jgi:hypothetical protein
MVEREEILTAKEAAQFLKVPFRTMESWRARGQGPAYLKYGRSTTRYRLKDLIEFLEKSRHQAGVAA